MAKNSNSKTSTPSRLRFVMVEAELGDGDIGPITQAIQNALRSSGTPVKRIAGTAVQSGSAAPTDVEPEIEDAEEEEIVEVVNGSTKARAPRKPSPTPDIVQIDMNANVSLSSFALGKDAKSQNKKFLIAAAWLKEHREIDAVTAGHIYTCFRSMEWPTNIPDFWQPLRDLKAKRYFTKNEGGAYEINHIGLDHVKKLGGSNGAS